MISSEKRQRVGRIVMAEQSTAMVIGASRGLGLALAEEWCERGWRVIATVRSRSKELEGLTCPSPTMCEVDPKRKNSMRAAFERFLWAV
jgi:NAD(P)-dependent dehydrogenase (short-subunit alcohol dehydrogenase family)